MAKAIGKSLQWIDEDDEDDEEETFLDARRGDEAIIFSPRNGANSLQTVALVAAALVAGYVLGFRRGRY